LPIDDDRFTSALAALRRKLRGLAAVAADPGAAPSERANAAALKKRLEQRLRNAGAPAGDWTDHVFRLGRRVKALRASGPTGPEEGDWTDQARRFGKAVGRMYKKWSAD
jgi:hypothetical protein